MPDALTLAAFISAITLGQSALSASVLGSRARHQQVYLPLALFFIALSVSGASAVVDAPMFQSLPRYIPHLMAGLSFPADLLLLPLFWFYVHAMTSERAQIWSRKDLLHLLPAAIGLAVFLLLLCASNADRIALFEIGRDRNSPIQTTLFFLIIGLYVTWLCQWLFYSIMILRRLLTYRGRLNELFASKEHLELGWIGWLGVLILADWTWIALVFVFEVFTDITPIEEPWLSLLDLALVWTISIWGQRQVPGLAAEVEATEAIERANPKYEKSALGDDQITRLAERIEAAMREDQLYRDLDLSLSVLAKHIGARPNYVSQTLNTRLNSTFFDYVNRWRIKDAQSRLTSSADTVLEIAIAVGFNTRSSFYTAFKRHCSMTPSAWRKTHKTN